MIPMLEFAYRKHQSYVFGLCFYICKVEFACSFKAGGNESDFGVME